MGPYQTRFQIRDLEEFSGVKAHTIRMWEKRYGLLSPDRTDGNFRSYGMDELKAILNVAFLNRHGYKISKIAGMTAPDRERLVGEVALSQGNGDEVLNSLKLAMLSFDELLFNNVSHRYQSVHGFRALVERIYVPLLEHIGLLWQSNAICPAQEHFVSNIIRHKLIMATEMLPMGTPRSARTFVLYLPENEIHELGLLYVNYLLRSKGERTIYLGQSVPTADLQQVASILAGPVVNLSLLMANPPAAEIPGYLKELRALLPDDTAHFMLAGAQLAKLSAVDIPPGMSLHPSLASLVIALDALV